MRPFPPRSLAAPRTLEPDRLLSSRLKPSKKSTLDLIGDWPWIAPKHLGPLLGVDRSRLSQLLGRLTELKLIAAHRVDRLTRLALTDRGIAYHARRDRTAVGAARQPWSARTPRPRCAIRLAQHQRGPKPPALATHHSHPIGARVHRIAGRTNPRQLMAGGATRSTAPSLPLLPSQRRKCALYPTGRVRSREAEKASPCALRRVGAASRPPIHHGRPPRPLPALLQHPPPD